MGGHASFKNPAIPILFFSCGLYKEYHTPWDTAEKLNYVNLQKSAAVIGETIRIFADR
jgi:hypothetical protein